MTIVLAGHLTATIRDADRIIVMIGAEVAAEGTHAELTATSDVYRNLFVDTHNPEDLQTDGFQHLPRVNLEKRIRT